MSGEGNTIESAWFKKRRLGLPGFFLLNYLLDGRPDDLDDLALDALSSEKLVAFQVRNLASLGSHETLRLSLVAAEQADSAIVAALAALVGGGETELDALKAAREANSTVMSLEAQMKALRDERLPGPQEAELLAAVEERRRRDDGDGDAQ